MTAESTFFLYGIDLEDVRTMVEGGERYPERVPGNVGRFLDFFERHGVRCTFFCVGDIARRYPSLVAEIAAAGHEIACHGSDHLPLDGQDRDGLRDDLERNLEDLGRAGVGRVRGYRAPVLSLTPGVAWAYEVLAELGFSYSSSVLPSRSPLYGWPGFGAGCRRTAAGVWEIPASLSGLPLFDVPFSGGVYFRVLPFFLVRRLFRRTAAAGRPVVGYAHPHDIDTEQERFMHPKLRGNRLYNWLMFVNRRRVFDRLERLLDEGARIVPYLEYVEAMLPAPDRPGAPGDG